MNVRPFGTLVLGVLLLSGCGGSDGEVAEGAEADDEAELRGATVTLELRDDGNLYAAGLHFEEPGGVWDHYVLPGERVRLRNASSQAAVFVVDSESTFADGRPRIVQFEHREVLHRTLRANRSVSFKVGARARFIQLRAYPDASEERDLLRSIVSEPDGADHFGATLTVRAADHD